MGYQTNILTIKLTAVAPPAPRLSHFCACPWWTNQWRNPKLLPEGFPVQAFWPHTACLLEYSAHLPNHGTVPSSKNPALPATVLGMPGHLPPPSLKASMADDRAAHSSSRIRILLLCISELNLTSLFACSSRSGYLIIAPSIVCSPCVSCQHSLDL